MATIDWKSPVSGLWSAGADWSGGVEPGAGDNAVIPGGASSAAYTITMTGYVAVADLTLDDPYANLEFNFGLAANNISNSGTMRFDFGTSVQATSLVNDGTIEVTGDTLDISQVGNLQAAGAGGVMRLDNGFVLLPNEGTTAAFLKEVMAQHISGNGLYWGIGFTGTLNNSGATLRAGAGSLLGEFTSDPGDVAYHSTISGGTLKLGNPGTDQLYVNVSHAVIDVAAPTLEVYNIDLSGDTISGVSTLTLVNPTHGSSFLDVDHTNFVGGPVTFDVLESTMVVGAVQPLGGDTIDLFYKGTLHLNGATMGQLLIDVGANSARDVGANSRQGSYVSFITGTGGFGASTDLFVGLGEELRLYGTLFNEGQIAGSSGSITLNCDFTNSGTINLTGASLYAAGPASFLHNSGVIHLVGGTLEVSPTQLSNTGSLSVTNGTLQLGGALTVASLSAVDHPGSVEEIGGTMSLGGKVVNLDSGYYPTLSQVGGDITDGTLAIRAGHSFSTAGLISVGVMNNGTLLVAPGSSATVAGSVSGDGTIHVSNNASLGIEGRIGTGETLDLSGGTHNNFGLLTTLAERGFAGTIAGFAPSDQIELAGTVTSAGFSGSSIVATLSNGITLALHTASALTGSISVLPDYKFSILVYASTASAGVGDWGSGGSGAHYGLADGGARAFVDGYASGPEWGPVLHMHGF